MTETLIHSSMAAAVEPWPEGGLEPAGRCPVCESADREVLHAGLHDQVFFCAPGTWTLYRCLACNSGYLDPRPTPETVGLAYSSYFTHSANSQPPIETLGVVRRLRRALANGYRNARFGLHRTPSNALGAWLVRFLPRQRAMIDAEVRHLSRAPAGATLLDVGCGNGEFLQAAMAMGWRAEGVDFDPQAVRIARQQGCVVYHGGIETLADRTACYDVVTLSHVIEHVHDPHSLLRACFRLLKPGGRLWLETPNLESAGHARYRRHWLHLDPPRHLVLFTWSSLNRALAHAGFARVEPLPLRPLARQSFPASEAISQGKNPFQQANHSVHVRWRAWWADTRGAASLTERELITLSAQKPSSDVDASAGRASHQPSA